MSRKTKIVAPISPSRRSVIVGSCGLAAVLVGCGSDSDEPSADAPTEDATDEGDASTPPTTPPPGNDGNVLAAAADVPVGGGVVVKDQEVVVTQAVEGEFAAYTAICTHKSCPLESVEDGEILCSQTCGHGSRFSAEDGSVTQGPAAAPLEEVAVTVEGDSIVLA